MESPMLYPNRRPIPPQCRRRATVRSRMVALRIIIGLAVGIVSAAPQQTRADEAPAEPQLSSLLAPITPSAAKDHLPQPLTPADAETYRLIFALQDQGLWPAADRHIRRLTDKTLMGHVLAQRYLHPTAYRSGYKELSDWLRLYADLPEAQGIHALAVKRKPAGAAPPPPAPAEARRAGAPENDVVAPSAEWLAGLDLWRQGRADEAAQQFEAAATDRRMPPWEVAAAAYWAGRAHLKAGQPEQVSRWLIVAAKRGESFYGQLARRALGMETELDFGWQPLVPAEAKELLADEGCRRALALLQVGKTALAEDELVALQARQDISGDILATVAQAADMPALALNLAVGADSEAPWRDAMRYPLPAWQPKDGFQVDRALVYAVMRHESGFNPQALSPSGAVGLMQLMPATADTLTTASNDFAGAKSRRLLDPELNVTLGQKYLRRLLDEESVDGDLIRLIAAYNAGPGKVAKWIQAIGKSDPLLFIESMPALQTRTFVQRVLASLWIYRQRMGQEAPSLDALAAGDWPAYDAQDDGARVALNGGN